jgi:histone deacetylase complex regulatory component SIN3
MAKLKYFLTISILLFFTTSLFAQLENTVKETKVKVEKQVEKVSAQADGAKEMVSKKVSKVKKGCDADCKKACCSKDAKKMKAEVSKKHGADCKCDGCGTASASMNKGEEMMKKAHAADCGCDGCKVANAEMKKHKTHEKDCSCNGCAKT